MNKSDALISYFNSINYSISEIAKKFYPAQAFDSNGKTSTFIVTDDCNLRCSYCYITKKHIDHRMDFLTAKKFVDQVFSANKHLVSVSEADRDSFHHGKVWDFVGGEPLLEYELVFKIMDYIIEKTNRLPKEHPWRAGFTCKTCKIPHPTSGYRFMVGSNGVLLSNPVIRSELEKRKQLISLAITLDGPKEMHDLCRFDLAGNGSFDKLMDIWPWFKENFPSNACNTKSTISHDNLKHITSVAKFFWEKMDITEILMNCVFENVWWRGDQLVLFDQLCNLADYLIEDHRYERYNIRWFNPLMGTKDTGSQKWCGAGTHMDSVAYDGTLYPCLRFKTTDRRPPIPLGTVDTWKDQKLLDAFNVINCHSEGTSIQKEVTGVDCAACPISALCSSCQAWSYDVHGRLDVKAVFICPMHKAAVFANYYMFGRLLEIFKNEDRYYLMDLLDQYTADDYFGYDELGNPIPEPWAHKEAV